jgi:DNA-binding CsgD family transcriptional regulator
MPATGPPLPGPLRLTPPLPFVGRAGELAVLDRMLAEAMHEGRRIALVQGEAGSGKTRLARQVAERAAGAGAGVLYGACDSSLPLPYQAFVEALEQLAEREPSAVAEVARGPGGAELGALLPGVVTRPPPAPEGGPDPRGGRYRLHAAVTDVLGAYSRGRPVVLVLDDLHWADASTLLLLRQLARTTAELPLLVIATARHVEAEAAPDLADALAELHRLDGFVHVPLGALDELEIADFVRRLAPGTGGDRVDALAEALADLTGGNAFLMAELAHDLADSGRLEENGDSAGGVLEGLGIPQGVRDVVGQRLARMAADTRGLVELAAVSARALELAVLSAAAPLDEAALLSALDEATASRMLEEVPGGRITYRFRHELLRRAVADRLSSARRAALHLRLATGLESVHGADAERSVNDLAFHFAQAAGLGGREPAVRYALRAAELAMRSFAYEEAVRQLRFALDLGIDEPSSRAQALCEIGTALHRSGHPPQALENYAAAAAVARDIGDVELLAQAAIGFENACWRPGIYDARSTALLEEATAAAGDRDGPRRVRLLASLSRAHAYRGEHVSAEATWRSAVEMARRTGDRRGLAVSLYHAAWTRGSQSPETVLRSLDEARDLFGSLGEDDLRLELDGFRLSLILEGFDSEALRRELRTFRGEAERAGQPFYLHVAAYVSSTLAVCDGHFTEAELMAGRALELSRQFDEDASAIHGIQMFTIRREQGRLAEVATLIRLMTERGADEGDAWGPALAVVLAELGMADEARRVLRRLCADGFAGVPRGGLWLGGLAYLADACALAGAVDLAAPIYGELSELEGKNVVIGQGVACYGAADRFLGMLAAMMGDAATAERHFEAALAHNGRLRSPTWRAHTAYEYGRVLRQGGGSAASARADELLAEAASTARETGMRALAERAQRAGAQNGPRALPDDLSPREAEVLRLISAGLSNRAIGEQLSISQHTAANHVRSILLKTGCANRTDAASYAHRHGLAEH